MKSKNSRMHENCTADARSGNQITMFNTRFKAEKWVKTNFMQPPVGLNIVVAEPWNAKYYRVMAQCGDK